MAESSSSSSGWEFIGNDGKRVESSDDNRSETSDSSIEVVSMDTNDLHSLESIQLPQIPSASSGPFLVLRLRSKEKDSLTESDESDDHKTDIGGTLKRRKKSKSRQPKTSEPEMSTPSEEERDFVTIPDPEKENAECVDNNQDEVMEEKVDKESQNEVGDGPLQGFHVVEAPQVEHQELVTPPPFEESGEVDQRVEEEEEDFMFLGVPQDDPDTESSPEMENEQDDRMESDRSGDPFSDDYSTLSNVDISDLMAENNLIRQYVFRPNPSVNVTLNMVMVVVISVAVGLGIGHALGSAKERFVNSNIQEMSVNMDLDGECPFDVEDVEKLTLENRELKEEANKAQNEVVDLRSEVRKLRYSPIVSTAEEKKRQTEQKNMALKSEVNMLQHENEDLKKLVGSLKYGSHPGNEDGGCQKKLSEGNLNDLFEKTEREMENEPIVEEESNDLKDAVRKPVSIVNIVHSVSNKKPQVQETNTENSVDKHVTDSNTLHSDNENKEAVENYHEEEELYEDMVQLGGKRALEEKQDIHDADQVYSVFDEEDKAIEDEEVTNTSTENVKTQKTEQEDMIEEDDGVEVLDEDYGDDVDEDEEVTNTSTENVQNLEDQPNTESAGSDRKGENRENASQAGKKVDWRETMQKILNKTKASVSDVSQQIQDTWKQVKNMSGDLWKKNEPVLTKLKTNLVMKVEEAAQKITSKLGEKTKNWFNKRRKQKENDRKHKNYPEKEHRHRGHHWRNQEKDEKYPKHRQNDDTYKEKRKKYENIKESKYYKAKTGRRTYKEEDNHKPSKRQQRRAEKLEKRRTNKFNKMKGRFQQIHEYRFCQMNMKKRHKFFNILEDFDERFNADRLLDSDQKWYSCQWDWWWNAISFHLNTFMLMDPSCQGSLLPWQEGILESGRWECPGFPQNLKRQSKFKEDDDDDDDDDEDDDNEKEDAKRRNFRNMPYFGDFESLPNSNYTEDFKGCDPTKGICDFNKSDSWYLMKMKFRQYQRFMDAKEKGKTDWMFSRASHRRDERERTDCSRGIHGAHVCG